MALVLLVPISKVWPSAGSRMNAAVPILPPAPALFSTITGWPRRSPSFWPSTRAITSVAPPGAHGTTILIGLVGKFCAMA